MPSLMPLSSSSSVNGSSMKNFSMSFVGLGDLLIQLGHVLFDLLFRLGGQSDLLAGDVVGLLGDEIDNADGLFAVQDREREGDDGGAEDIAQGVERIEEVRMLLVELRNIEHCGQTGVGRDFQPFSVPTAMPDFAVRQIRPASATRRDCTISAAKSK